MTAKSKTLTERIVIGLRRKASLTDVECYAALAPTFVPAMGTRAVQVCPGGDSNEGGGNGAQDGGGCLYRRQRWTLAVWWRVNLDEVDMSEQVLLEAGESMQDFTETIRSVLGMTFLGVNMLTEPLRWDGSTDPEWADIDGGIVSRTISISGPYAVDLPSAVSILEQDFE